MKFNLKFSIIFLLNLFDSLHFQYVAPLNLPIVVLHPSAKFERLLTASTKHVPETVEKHTAAGHSAEGHKKSVIDEHHDFTDKKQLSKGSHHKSSEDSSSANKGSDTKESHSKKYDEEAGHEKKTEDEADESSFHDEGDHKAYGGKHNSGKKHKVRKFEQGFFKTYHKKERNKKSNFFEDHHKGGDFKKYGQAREKFYSTSSKKKAKKDGQSRSSATFVEGSKKNGKIK